MNIFETLILTFMAFFIFYCAIGAASYALGHGFIAAAIAFYNDPDPLQLEDERPHY